MATDSTTDIQPLLDRISGRKSKLRGPTFIATLGISIFAIMHGIVFVVALLLGRRNFISLSPFPFIVLGFSLLWSYILLFDRRRKWQIKTLKQEILQLTHCDDVRAVPALLDEFSNKDSDVRLAVRAGLLRLLPKLQATDARLFNTEQREILYEFLSPKEIYHEDFFLAVFHALGQIGDRHALHLMRKRSDSLKQIGLEPSVFMKGFHVDIKAMKHSPRFFVLKAALEESITVIEARLDAEQSGATLLRGSRQPADLPETLLRPAAATAPTDPNQLLRPAPPDPD